MGESLPPAPGHAWFEIITRDTPEAFASAFTQKTVLHASVLNEPLAGAAAIRAFFTATRAMYERIAFVHETRSTLRTCLKWDGIFQGREVAGTTILSHDKAGRIECVCLYHRPYDQIVAFAAELARRLSEPVLK